MPRSGIGIRLRAQMWKCLTRLALVCELPGPRNSLRPVLGITGAAADSARARERWSGQTMACRHDTAVLPDFCAWPPYLLIGTSQLGVSGAKAGGKPANRVAVCVD